jgi:hypothetical protein
MTAALDRRLAVLLSPPPWGSLKRKEAVMTKTLDKSELAQFTGSESWYRDGINRAVLFTDGANYVADQTGVLTCDDSNGRVIFSKELEYTDFPLGGITLYFTNNTILLPSEY